MVGFFITQNALVNADRDMVAYADLLLSNGAVTNTLDRFKHTCLMSLIYKVRHTFVFIKDLVRL